MRGWAAPGVWGREKQMWPITKQGLSGGDVELMDGSTLCPRRCEEVLSRATHLLILFQALGKWQRNSLATLL